MSISADGGNLDEVSRTSEDWQELSNEEQDELLSDAFDRETGRTGASTQQRTQAGAPAPDVAKANAAGFRELMDGTWDTTAQGVTVEMNHLNDNMTKEIMGVAFELFDLADAEDELETEDPQANPEEAADEIDDELVEMFLGGDEEFDTWLNQMLGKVTADDIMDESWWADGVEYPGGTKLELFVKLIQKAASALEAIESFR